MAIAQVIKCEGKESTFIWRHPAVDFNSLTQLIVHESQEAIFMMNGQALDTFGPGRYLLDSENTPVLQKFINMVAHGGISPFHCEIYFVNKNVKMGVKWGTDSKIRYIDPDSGIPIEIGACGEMNLEVLDGRKLLIKLVGTKNGIAWDDDREGHFAKTLQESFRPLINTAIKSNLSVAIKNEQINIFEVDEHLDKLSSVLKKKIAEGFNEYGLGIPQFYITTVVLPDDDPNFKRLKELNYLTLRTRMIKAEASVKTAEALAEADVIAARRQAEMERQLTHTEITKKEAEREVITASAEAERKRLSGMADAEIMRAKGYTQKDVIDAEVQKAYAEGLGKIGSGSGTGSSMMSDMVGIGAGIKAAGIFAGQVGEMLNIGQTVSNGTVCTKCGSRIPTGSKFCPECGNQLFVTNKAVCPNCGKELYGNSKFCPECGAKL